MTAEEAAALRARLCSPGGWQRIGNVDDPRHMEAMSSRLRNRSRCGCGCDGKASHTGYANGLALTSGCELSMRRWVRDGYAASEPQTGLG
jgi:hypothetical protein